MKSATPAHEEDVRSLSRGLYCHALSVQSDRHCPIEVGTVDAAVVEEIEGTRRSTSKLAGHSRWQDDDAGIDQGEEVRIQSPAWLTADELEHLGVQLGTGLGKLSLISRLSACPEHTRFPEC